MKNCEKNEELVNLYEQLLEILPAHIFNSLKASELYKRIRENKKWLQDDKNRRSSSKLLFPKKKWIEVFLSCLNRCLFIILGCTIIFGLFILNFYKNDSYGGLLCTHYWTMKMLPWLRVGCKMSQHSDFRRKNGCLGVFLCRGEGSNLRPMSEGRAR